MPDTRVTKAALPLYLQISESLIREIAAGRLVAGERLPPERQLAQRYNTTVRTLRKSLAELEKQGLLERVQGSGNFIRTNENSRSIYSMFRLELPQGGGLPTAEILSVDYVAKDGLPSFGTSDYGSRIRRLRYINDAMIAVEEIWLDGDSGRVDASQLSDSLYRYYHQKHGFWIHRAEDRVWVADVPNWSPPNFGIAVGSQAGYIERFSWAQHSDPVEFSRTWFDPNQAHYVQRLK